MRKLLISLLITLVNMSYLYASPMTAGNEPPTEGSAEYFAAIAVIYYRIGTPDSYDQAIIYVEKALAINSNNSEAIAVRGLINIQKEDYRNALMDLNKAIEIDPTNSFAFFGRGLVKTKLGDYRGAISDYNYAVRLNSSFSDAYFNRGISKYLLNDLNGACQDWSKAGELGMMEAYDLINKYCNNTR